MEIGTIRGIRQFRGSIHLQSSKSKSIATGIMECEAAM